MFKVILLCVLVQMAYCGYPITPDSCSPSEYYVNCKPICEARCNVPTPPYCGTDIVVMPREMCFPGCVCRMGFYRNLENNKCVMIHECPRRASEDSQ